MKRIVQCPKCQAKLSVFDMGKPINQKCPKCGEAFVIESEQSKKPTEAKSPPPKADALTEVKAEKTAEPKVEAKTELPGETKAETKTDAKTDVKADGKADTKTDVKPEAKTDAKPETKTESKPEVKAEEKTDAKTNAKPEVKTDAKPEDKSALKPEDKPDAKPETKSDAKPEAKAISTSKEPAVKKTIGKTAATLPKSSTASESNTPPETDHSFSCGISFFDVMIIIGLLIFSLVLQVIGIRKDASRFDYLDQQMQSIKSQLKR